MQISSPGYPDSYPSGLTCIYNLTSSASRVRVNFTALDINLYNDYVYIYDGSKVNKYGNLESPILDTYCTCGSS